jgi:hypothetical protein
VIHKSPVIRYYFKEVDLKTKKVLKKEFLGEKAECLDAKKCQTCWNDSKKREPHSFRRCEKKYSY